MSSTRREFLVRAAAGAPLLAAGASLPGFLCRTARAAADQGRGKAARDERILVVVQLSGGNDGLNTVIPFADDRYHKARPTLRVAPERVLRLNDAVGLNPEMSGFKRLFDDGQLAVINNVGYPNPDRSHFRSMDIWHTALLGPENARDGWLGRVVDREKSDGDAPLALHMDDDSLPLALKSRHVAVPSIRDIAAFKLHGDARALAEAVSAPRADSGATSDSPTAAALRAAHDDLLFVQRTAVASCRNAQRLEQIVSAEGAAGGYPDFRLAGRLRQIAQLIGADFGPRIYYTSLGGFDTHARQVLAHGPLLRELSESVAAFYADLKRRGTGERVLLLTFSEFGRRVAENGSQGTDHGAAAPMFLAGPACKAGVHGAGPDLGRLIEGDVAHALDFRGVYAEVLQNWLKIDAAAVLGGRFAAPGLI